MKITDATTDRIRQRREKLERAGLVKPEFNGVPQAIHLWHADRDGWVTRLSEPSEIPGFDVVALPAGKFLPEHGKGAKASLPQQLPGLFDAGLPFPVRRIRLVDAPANPHPPPEHTAEVIEFPKANERVEIDTDAVLIDLEKRRASQPDHDVKQRAREAAAAYRNSRKAQEVAVEEMPAPKEPARMLAMPPPWRPS